jgi:membrane-bound serine protease (ClpP class)
VTLALVLTLAGFLLTTAEVLFPSLGMFGIAAAACIVGADVVAAQQVGPTFFWILLAVQVVAIPSLLKTAFWLLPKLPFGRGMLLAPPAPEPSSAVERSEHLLGVEGVAESDLRPSGTARFGDERRSVVAEAGVVERGTPVVVSAVEGFRIVVRPKTAVPHAARTEGGSR